MNIFCILICTIKSLGKKQAEIMAKFPNMQHEDWIWEEMPKNRTSQ